MEIRPIRTPADYKAALKVASAFFENEPEEGSAAAEHFEVLLTLLDAYETRQFPIAQPHPIEAIKFRMEQGGLSVNDLVPFIGAKNRVYEVLNQKRPLTLAMIRALHEGLGIPAEVLIQPASVLGGTPASRVKRTLASAPARKKKSSPPLQVMSPR